MLPPFRLAAALGLCAAPGLVAHAQERAGPPVQVQVDIHVPMPVQAVPAPPPPAPPERPRRHPAPPAQAGRPFRVPPDRVPERGMCRIWYDELPPDRQPPPMACDRAHHIARRHGGRVIWAESSRAHQDGRVASAPHGFADFRGVPPDRLPPPGSCRVWLEGIPPDRQPPPGPCAHAEQEARRTGGRLLYMPGP